jgi:hypothetical protein
LENVAKFHITPHFARRVSERSVSVEEAKAVVKYCDHKQKQYIGEHKGIVFRFSKTVEGVKLCVVAELKNDECWLITGFYE